MFVDMEHHAVWRRRFQETRNCIVHVINSKQSKINTEVDEK